jgi:hypothetical protein
MHEERWVAQTRYMSIDASSFGQGTFLNAPTPPPAGDASMVRRRRFCPRGHARSLPPPSAVQSMDVEDIVCNSANYPPIFIPQSTHSHAPAYHVPEIHVSGAPSSYPTPAPSPRPLAFAQPQPHHASPHMGINVAIPPTRTFLRAVHDAAQTPPIADAGMRQLPLPMHAPQPQQRARFMMGPRADCEKCRLGVRGHYAHVD